MQSPRPRRARADQSIAHGVGEQVSLEHKHEHEDESRGERPPHHRLARHLQPSLLIMVPKLIIDGSTPTPM